MIPGQTLKRCQDQSKEAEFTTSSIDSQSSKWDWNQIQRDDDGKCFYQSRVRNDWKLISWDSSLFQRNLSDCTLLLVGLAVLDLPFWIKRLNVVEAATSIGFCQNLLARSIYFTGKLTHDVRICIIHAVKSVGTEELRRSILKRSHGLKEQARHNFYFLKYFNTNLLTPWEHGTLRSSNSTECGTQSPSPWFQSITQPLFSKLCSQTIDKNSWPLASILHTCKATGMIFCASVDGTLWIFLPAHRIRMLVHVTM